MHYPLVLRWRHARDLIPRSVFPFLLGIMLISHSLLIFNPGAWGWGSRGGIVLRLIEVLAALLCFYLSRVFWTLARTTYRVFEDCIIREKRGQPELEIRFEQISAVEFPIHTRGMNLFKIVSNVGVLRLGSLYPGSEYVLDAIHNARPGLMRASDFQDTRRALTEIDALIGLRRLWFSAQNIKYFLLSYLPPTCVALYFAYSQHREYALEWSSEVLFWVISANVAMVTLQFCHIQILNRRFHSKIKRRQLAAGMPLVPLTAQEESQLFGVVLESVCRYVPLHVFLVLCAMTTIWVSDWNLYEIVQISRDYPLLELRSGQEVWKDRRYHCLSASPNNGIASDPGAVCKHPLKKGDVLFIEDFNEPVFLVGLPQDTISLNHRARFGFGHEVFGDAMKLKDSEIAIQYLEFQRPMNIKVGINRVEALLQRSHPYRAPRTEPLAIRVSPVIQPSDFSFLLKDCAAPEVLKALREATARINVEAEKYLAEKKYLEAKASLTSAGKVVEEVTARCPMLAKSISERFMVAKAFGYDVDKIVIMKDLIDALNKQAALELEASSHSLNKY